MKRIRIYNKIARMFDLENEPIPGMPLIEIVSDQSVLVENHCGVISYSPEQIAIKTKSGCVLITGSGLVLNRMSCELLRICGRIEKVEMKGRRTH